MRLFSLILFILFNIYLIESANRTESDNSEGGFVSENVLGGAQDKSDDLEEVTYVDYEYDDSSRQNSISGKSEALKNSTEPDAETSFPNEVFLSLRNITADAATAFRSFTNRNDVVDLQASASDNLNVTTNETFADAESAGINLRALRDAGHPPQIIEETLAPVHLPYKHTKIDTADLSDCALQGEWKPIGVAHGHLHVGGGDSHQADVLQSVGSYAIPNKVPHWQQNVGGGGEDFQNIAYNHKPSGLYAGDSGYGSGYGYTGTGGFSGGQFQKIKSASMLSPPPVPPIIFGKKPGYWKLPKTKHKFFPGKGRRPGGVYGFSSQVNHGGSGYASGYSGGFGGYSGAAHGGIAISGSSGSGHGVRGSVIPFSGGSGHGYGAGSSISGGSTHGFGGGSSISGGFGGASISGGSGHGYGGGALVSGGSSHGYGGGASISGSSSHGYGGGSGGSLISGGSSHGIGGGTSVSGGSGHGYSSGGLSISGDSAHIYSGNGGSLSLSAGALDHSGGGAVAAHLIDSSNSAQASGIAVEELHSGSDSSGYITQGGGTGHLISASAVGSGVGDGQTAILIQNTGNTGHLVALNQGGGDTLLPEAAFLSNNLNKPSGGGHYHDSTFSSTHISQGIGNSLPDASFLSGHLGQGDDSSFTCGKNHDHNTNYHTATFQVADHDHPSSVDVLQYGGDAAVLIQSGDPSFHDHVLPERKHYKAAQVSDSQVSGSDNELTSQAAKLTGNPTEQVEADPVKLDDGDEPERHSYYHEITKVTKIPANTVGTVEYTFSKYETKPQTFSTESEPAGEEQEVEQPQIIRELEHLSDKFQLDLENPQKLFEDPPAQELAYHYPFQDGEQNQEPVKEGQEGVTDFPYQFYHENPNPPHPVVYKKPVKYIHRPGKFHQKVSYRPKQPVVVLRKHKPKQFLNKKKNYEVHEHGGERHRPVGEIFPPQKFPKQFHNPKPNFAVDRPKNGWRQEGYHEYKYDHSHGKKVKKFRTKGKIVAPILIRRPVSPPPVIRVVEVTG